MSASSGTLAVLAAAKSIFTDAVKQVVISTAAGDSLEVAAFVEGVADGAVALDGQYIAERGVTLHIEAQAAGTGFAYTALQGAKVEVIDASGESVTYRVVSCMSHPGGGVWSLTCAAEGKAT